MKNAIYVKLVFLNPIAWKAQIQPVICITEIHFQ